MYGKVFASMYEGSMVGAGCPVFAVWGYCIAKADPNDHTVTINPALLAAILGCDRSVIDTSLTYLTSPDPRSRNQEHDGCRLVHVSGHEYLVVSHDKYRSVTCKDDIRAYNREAKRRERASMTVNDKSTITASASVSESLKEEGVQGEKKTSRFVKPSPIEVAEYAQSIGFKHLANFPEEFIDFYESKGWVVGKTPMKNWKAAVRTWKQKHRETEEDRDYARI